MAVSRHRQFNEEKLCTYEPW